MKKFAPMLVHENTKSDPYCWQVIENYIESAHESEAATITRWPTGHYQSNIPDTVKEQGNDASKLKQTLATWSIAVLMKQFEV